MSNQPWLPPEAHRRPARSTAIAGPNVHEATPGVVREPIAASGKPRTSHPAPALRTVRAFESLAADPHRAVRGDGDGHGWLLVDEGPGPAGAGGDAMVGRGPERAVRGEREVPDAGRHALRARSHDSPRRPGSARSR